MVSTNYAFDAFLYTSAPVNFTDSLVRRVIGRSGSALAQKYEILLIVLGTPL